jgi:hypothetical protein
VSVASSDPDAWVDIEDSDGKSWRYVRGQRVQDGTPAHVRVHLSRQSSLTGLALSQPESGLPEQVVVVFEGSAGPGLGGAGVWGAGGGTYEYDLQGPA